MFLFDGQLRWSASDLTAAASCEFALLRALDYQLGRAEPIEQAADRGRPPDHSDPWRRAR